MTWTSHYLCLRNSLAACLAFASEFGMVLVQLRFPGCAQCFLSNVLTWFSTSPNCVFAAKLFLTFSDAACYLEKFLEKFVKKFVDVNGRRNVFDDEFE